MKSSMIANILTIMLFSGSIIPLMGQNEEEDVIKVLSNYHNAIENLDAAGTENLFSKESQIFESGGVEGTYAHYLEHHLGPELKAFTSFKFSDYKADVVIDGIYAFVTETYNYTIVLAEDERIIERKGVATSILKKINGEWKIVKSHSSSRNPG